MTYNVFGGILNLAQSQSRIYLFYPVAVKVLLRIAVLLKCFFVIHTVALFSKYMCIVHLYPFHVLMLDSCLSVVSFALSVCNLLFSVSLCSAACFNCFCPSLCALTFSLLQVSTSRSCCILDGLQ